MAYGLLLLRAFTGAAFAGHGTQKLFGWFGGHGPQGSGGFFSSLGYHPGVQMAVVAGLGEAVGGTLLAFGFLTPVAGTLLAIVMLNAIAAATLKKQFLLGSELELVYLVIAISLVATGPGRFFARPRARLGRQHHRPLVGGRSARRRGPGFRGDSHCVPKQARAAGRDTAVAATMRAAPLGALS